MVEGILVKICWGIIAALIIYVVAAVWKGSKH